jgi:hypothetical protein
MAFDDPSIMIFGMINFIPIFAPSKVKEHQGDILRLPSGKDPKLQSFTLP